MARAPSKKDRCALAECPLAGTGDPRCARCTGPVSWTGADGKRCGVGGATHRSCTNCPMNGLGLPVCWAGCDGPNPEFQTDGKSMVTLGGMADGDSYLGNRISPDARRASESGPREFGAMEMALAAALLRMDSQTWLRFSAACKHRDARTAAREAGVPAGAFRGPDGAWEGSAADGIMKAMGGMRAAHFEIIRGIATGGSQKRVADLAGRVSKQSVNQMIKRMERERPWVRRLVDENPEK